MATRARVVTGSLKGLGQDETFNGATVRFNITKSSYDDDELYPKEEVTITLDANGDFPSGFDLWCNTDALRPTRYVCTLPDNSRFKFNLDYGDGSAVDITTLRAAGTAMVEAGDPQYTIAQNLVNQAIVDHAAESDPHTVYLTQTEGDARYLQTSALGTNVETFLGTPSSANFGAAITDETGSGSLVFATSPTLVTPDLGTPSAGVLTNCTGTAAGLTAGSVSSIAGLAPDTATTAAAQPNITSLGTLTALDVDNININGNTIQASSGAVNITPAAGSAIVLDGTINVDAGVVTGATSITSTSFVGALTGNADTVTTNANLTGQVTSVGNAATLDKTAISDQALVTAAGTDHVIIIDATDGNLKKALISDFASAGGDMTIAVYDPGTVSEQLVGLTATQTLTNKTLTDPTISSRVKDSNGNPIFFITATTSAVNEFTIANAAAGNGPTLSTSGSDGSIDINLSPKGSGLVVCAKDLTVPDEAYGVGWNGSTEVPTKNAVYDKVETLGDMLASTYDAASVSEQLVGLTATQTLTNKTLTDPTIGTRIKDTNGNDIIFFTATGSAVNEFGIANAAVSNGPTLSARGSDGTIDINLTPKGAGGQVVCGGDLTVPDEAYGAGWNGSLEVPTKNAVYDKIETVGDMLASTYDGASVNEQLVGLTATQTLTNKTLTDPQIGTRIKDTNGNDLINFTATGSAVNEFTIANAAAGNAPELSVVGSDGTINLELSPKGGGGLVVCNKDLTVPDEAYGAGWNASLEVPTKNAVYDVIETITGVMIGVAISDETTDLTTGTAKVTFRMPFAMTLDSDGLRANVNTAPVGSTIIIDINEGGSTIMTTNKLSIDASEKTSETAATAPGITDTALADDAEITIDIDQVGSTTTGKGAKVWFIGTRT